MAHTLACLYICAQLCGGTVRRLKYWPREKIRPVNFPPINLCAWWFLVGVAPRWCPLKRALLLLVSSFIENNWKIDDSSSGLFKEGGMELSLLLYCIPFVYSGQCSALSTRDVRTHRDIIKMFVASTIVFYNTHTLFPLRNVSTIILDIYKF